MAEMLNAEKRPWKRIWAPLDTRWYVSRGPVAPRVDGRASRSARAVRGEKSRGRSNEGLNVSARGATGPAIRCLALFEQHALESAPTHRFNRVLSFHTCLGGSFRINVFQGVGDVSEHPFLLVSV
jgi:hypothetical protein